MTHKSDCTLPTKILEQIAEQGLEVLPDPIRIIISAAMQVERQAYLGVQSKIGSSQRGDYASGFKPKIMATCMGESAFDFPQERNEPFYPNALVKGISSKRAPCLLRPRCACKTSPFE